MNAKDIKYLYSNPQAAIEDETVKRLIEEIPQIWAKKAALWELHNVLGQLQHEFDFGTSVNASPRAMSNGIQERAEQLPDLNLVLKAIR